MRLATCNCWKGKGVGTDGGIGGRQDPGLFDFGLLGKPGRPGLAWPGWLGAASSAALLRYKYSAPRDPIVQSCT